MDKASYGHLQQKTRNVSSATQSEFRYYPSERGSPMNSKTLIASLALVAGIAGITPIVQAAQTSSEPAVQSPTSDRQLKVNDRAPEMYQRKEEALKNWKAKGLKAPIDQSQWVQINDQYVMVMITNGTIVEMQPVER
jgi:hypothetical protein